ncbi:DUF2147 domain-containing protein [Aequorivita capsosiphonis]|uniref:DUF2147 domain-containing protein n=1 Tax=Aequorivita capsosiphonis TaxID=487317 RepID=UPI00047E9197|nr:DUF2147 domain-containing protein [Aequorivita capsosiphonis]
MKNWLLSVSFGLLFCFYSNAQDILGKWKTFNSHTGEVRSIVEVFQQNGKLYGKVLRIMDEEDRDNLCTECEGEDKNQKIEGLVLMKNFEKDGGEYVDGTITNPNDGKIYRSKVWIDENDPNILNVRGYIGFFYKTMEWERIIE